MKNAMREKLFADLWSHELWSTRAQRQVDFISSTLMDGIRLNTFVDFTMLDLSEGETGHRALAVDFGLCANPTVRKGGARVQAGWKPELDEHCTPSIYHQALDVRLTGRSIAADVAHLSSSQAAKLCQNIIKIAKIWNSCQKN